MSGAVDVRFLAKAERADLADLLESLTPEQWSTPSLCDGWSVRDVVAHVYSYEGLGIGGLVARFVTGGLLPDRVNAAGVAKLANQPVEALAGLARDHLEPQGLTSLFGGRIALTDGLIHHQDIRRPLNLPRKIPPDRLRPALDFALTAPTLRARKRVRGLRLVATDLDWEAGTGKAVEGPAEALLLAIAGRPIVISELAGPGQPILAARLS